MRRRQSRGTEFSAFCKANKERSRGGWIWVGTWAPMLLCTLVKLLHRVEVDCWRMPSGTIKIPQFLFSLWPKTIMSFNLSISQNSKTWWSSAWSRFTVWKPQKKAKSGRGGGKCILYFISKIRGRKLKRVLTLCIFCHTSRGEAFACSFQSCNYDF